ncbi:MAG: Undecaprenyl-phosphate mannosyltransferase [Verrucomicrobiae bacterium]|nr:Undecaprenyl-phosphate mannosyltransferase [Verrucomicrobiae bacterium]
MRVSLILLVLNEIDGLKVIVPKLDRGLFCEVVAVDGGSTDGSVEYLKEQNIPIVSQSKRGRGQAFTEGVRHAHGDAFLFFSPDGNEDPADFAKFIQHLDAGADLVIASRMMKGAVNEEDSEFFKPRRWANNAFNLIINLAFNAHPCRNYITDSINGYRAFRRTLLPVIEPFPLDYTVEYRMTGRALAAKAKIVEFPTHEFPRIAGETKIKSLQAGMRFLKATFQELGRKFKS